MIKKLSKKDIGKNYIITFYDHSIDDKGDFKRDTICRAWGQLFRIGKINYTLIHWDLLNVKDEKEYNDNIETKNIIKSAIISISELCEV